jgi:hypothetical protein
LNTYGYAGNNPLTRIDPTGKFFFVPWLGYSAATALADLTLMGGTTYAINNAYNQSSEEDNGQDIPIDLPDKIPEFDFNNPGQCPIDKNGNQWPWKGKLPQGGDKGGYKNPNGPQSLHPDLDHGGDIGPHWDFNDRTGPGYRIGPDGTIWPK